MSHISRRHFLRAGLAATTLAGSGRLWAAKRSATDLVPLGKTGVKVSRLAFGTGTFSGRVQRDLGQEGFNRLVRYAYDHGIRFFESAEAYPGMMDMLGIALKGLPRDSYQLMTKWVPRQGVKVQDRLDAYRRSLNTEHIDILLLHYMNRPTWVEDTKFAQDGYEEAKQKKIISAHGASCHGLQALARFPGNPFLDVALLRVNHKGTRMDTPEIRDSDNPGDVTQVVSQAKKIHAQGTAILGMKLIGEGAFTTPEDREKSMNFVMGLGVVDAVTIGYKNTAEIDEALSRMTRALNA